MGKHSILFHSCLNPAWHFWLSTRFSCCLKMKSVENILGYIREQFYRFSRGCKPRENLWNCSRKVFYCYDFSKIALRKCCLYSSVTIFHALPNSWVTFSISGFFIATQKENLQTVQWKCIVLKGTNEKKCGEEFLNSCSTKKGPK